MLFFGYIIDKIGRRTGIVFATLFLILGVVLATAAHGNVCVGPWCLIFIFMLTSDSQSLVYSG